MKPLKKDSFTIIAGCGRLGANLANTLSDGGGSVIVIDRDQDAFRKLSPDFGGISIQGDATDTGLLAEAGIAKAAAVVSVTNYDNTNILIAQIAKEYFHVEHVIARLYDSEKECVYNEFGIETICPAALSQKEIDKVLGLAGTESAEA